jgi:hypothetical protein
MSLWQSIQQGMQNMTPLQRAMLMRAAAGNIRNPAMQRGLMQGGDDIMRAAEIAEEQRRRSAERVEDRGLRREEMGAEQQYRGQVLSQREREMKQEAEHQAAVLAAQKAQYDRVYGLGQQENRIRGIPAAVGWQEWQERKRIADRLRAEGKPDEADRLLLGLGYNQMYGSGMFGGYGMGGYGMGGYGGIGMPGPVGPTPDDLMADPELNPQLQYPPTQRGQIQR